MMNINQLKKRFKSFISIAENLVNDKSKTFEKVKEGFEKATANKGALSNVWEQLQLLFSLAKDYANGTYTGVSRRSIIAIIGSLLYFISPIDLIPDFIFGLGFVDDAFILGLVYKQVTKDLEKYQAWKDRKRLTIHI